MPVPDTSTPSAAEQPDLDWSQVRETVLMLQAATAQIQASMTDGGESVAVLTELFASMAGKTRMIGDAAQQLPASSEQLTIESAQQGLEQRIQSAIVAFQFYDTLTQRLQHVVSSLNSLADLVDDRERLYNPYEWNGLQELIKSSYTFEADRAMFTAILNGASVGEALKIASAKSDEHDSGDVEFF